MRRKVTRKLGSAARGAARSVARAAGANKGKIGVAAAGVALVAGAVVLAKKQRSRRKLTEGSGAVASEPQADGVAETPEAAKHIPVAVGADLIPRGDSRKGTMTEAPVPGARFNETREDRKNSRMQ